VTAQAAYRKNQQELESFSMETISKSNYIKYLRNYQVKKGKTITGPTESTGTDLILCTLKYSPISGETVPLKY
jgi:hypothetical protein